MHYTCSNKSTFLSDFVNDVYQTVLLAYLCLDINFLSHIDELMKISEINKEYTSLNANIC